MFSVGATFDKRYEILAKLGEGGFGAVYKARQHTTGQMVALKWMRPLEHAGLERAVTRAARFLREVQLCAELKHPNIVQLLDAGQTEDGHLYTVFGFAPGETLASVLAQEGALTPREARHLMLQVLDALACAHLRGVVHRDLKPGNIMVIPTGARRNALVLDFGISGLVEEEGRLSTQAPPLTATNESLGTPGYVAPEQLRGARPSPRADLFAWGLILLECLTGQRAYPGNSSAEILYEQLGPNPVPIPAALDRHPLGDLLRKVTRKDVNARDITAQELLEAFDACPIEGISHDLLLGHHSDESGKALHQRLAFPSGRTQISGLREGERRQLTAVCCNITLVEESPKKADGTEADASAPDDQLRSAMAIAARIACAHGGHLAAALGQQLLIYFGYPHAEEDDAQRAARAALSLRKAARSEADPQCEGMPPIEVCIGIHTGFVVTNEPTFGGDVGRGMGATPQRAARLANWANPGTILVTEDAKKLLDSGFDLLPEGSRSGDGEPSPIYLLRWAKERSTGTPP